MQPSRMAKLLPVEYPHGGPVGSKAWEPNSPSGAYPGRFATGPSGNQTGLVSERTKHGPKPRRHSWLKMHHFQSGDLSHLIFRRSVREWPSKTTSTMSSGKYPSGTETNSQKSPPP